MRRESSRRDETRATTPRAPRRSSARSTSRPRRARAGAGSASPRARPNADANRRRADRPARRARARPAHARRTARRRRGPRAGGDRDSRRLAEQRAVRLAGPDQRGDVGKRARSRELRRVAAAVVDSAVADQRDRRLEDRQSPVQRLLGGPLGVAPLARARRAAARRRRASNGFGARRRAPPRSVSGRGSRMHRASRGSRRATRSLRSASIQAALFVAMLIIRSILTTICETTYLAAPWKRKRQFERTAGSRA